MNLLQLTQYFPEPLLDMFDYLGGMTNFFFC